MKTTTPVIADRGLTGCAGKAGTASIVGATESAP
jgi:hypothetical protein